MTDIDQRRYIKNRTALGATAISIHDDLVVIHGDKAYAMSTIWKWIARFKDGRDNPEDDPRSGRPVTETTPANIERVKSLIDGCRNVSYSILEGITSLSHGTLVTIIKDHLKLRKLSARWIPYHLSPENQAKRLAFAKACLEKFESGQWRLDQIITGDESWFYHRHIDKKQSNAAWTAEGQERATVVRRNRFEAKTLFSFFFRTTGPLLIQPFERTRKVDAPNYLENCLKPTFEFVKKIRKKKGVYGLLLLDDNASPHRTPDVIKYVQDMGMQIIDHPPYSPDLAPCDYWLFDHIKNHLGDEETSQTIATSIARILNKTDKSLYRKAIEQYPMRLKMCIEQEGAYFEHLIK